ncbi:MAG: hemerythrin domain-containing protein [Planctomycetota bacterium]|jgi:hemerythrin-like domain-containing protein
MTKDVEQLMNGLRGDHRNMALLLDLLDAEIDRLSASEEPDYDLVRDIVLYMTEYPDVVHHPKEDIVFRHLKSLRPEIRTDLERVETDHQYLEESGLKLKKDMEAISNGAELDRGELIEKFHHYMEQLREHMYWEETDLFSVADELQLHGDWSEVVLKNNEISDPLFGSRVERKYRKLLARIQERVVWDSQRYLV